MCPEIMKGTLANGVDEIKAAYKIFLVTGELVVN